MQYRISNKEVLMTEPFKEKLYDMFDLLFEDQQQIRLPSRYILVKNSNMIGHFKKELKKLNLKFRFLDRPNMLGDLTDGI